MFRSLTVPVVAMLVLVVAPTAEARSVRGDLGPAAGTPRQVARAALERFEGRLRVDASAFRLEAVRRSVIGTHVRGRQFRRGVAVEGTAAIVSIVGGRVVWVQADASSLPGGPAARPVAPRAARATALGALGVSLPARVRSERLLVARGRRLVDVTRVSVLSLRPAVAKTVDVSTATGRVLAVRSDVVRADATAPLFDPNPVVTTKDPSLRQPGLDASGVDTDLDSGELTAARVEMPLFDYDASQAAAGRLVGPWVNVQGAQPFVESSEGRFDQTRGMPGFEGLMAYAHVDRFQRYLQADLGFAGQAGVNAESQDMIAFKVEGFDNSFYQPGNDVIVMGAGGVDDGEDADIIIHEYGHAVQDAQVAGWGEDPEGGAMGEAFGDFQAAAYYARAANAFNDLCVGDWDATSYSTDDPPCLRRLDSTKVYPKDIVNQVHADGEIWSAFLWRIRDGLGTTPVEKSDRSLKLVLASHELLTVTAKFADGVAALRTAATALGHPDWIAVIDESAIRAGFMKRPATPPPAPPAAPAAAPPAPASPADGSDGAATPRRVALSIRCTRRLTCRITAPAGSAAASATRARLLRGRKLLATGRVRRGRVTLRRAKGVRRVRPGRYTVQLFRGNKRVQTRTVRVPR